MSEQGLATGECHVSSAQDVANHLYAQFDHLDPPLGADGTPYAYYEALRDAAIEADEPMGWSDSHGGFWVVTGYNACIEIMRDPDAFSNAGVIFPRYAVSEPLMIVEQDEPEHMRYRKLVNLSFMPKNVSGYSEVMADATNDLIDGFIADGRIDLVRAVADAVPAIITAVLLGFPIEDGPRFGEWTIALAHEFITDPEAAKPKIEEMYAYFEDAITLRKKSPSNDLISQIIQSKLDGRPLNHEEILGFCTLLLIGGIENSAKVIGNALWRLGWDIELRRQLVDDPSKIGRAVEEFLRLYTPGHVGRLASRDCTIFGKKVKAGQHIMLALPVANRDPAIFVLPDALSLQRPKSVHLALGSGTHVCIGQHLIRLEAQIVLREFLKRIPEYRLDPDLPQIWTKGQVGGMSRVPVVFTPGMPIKLNREPGVEAWLQHAKN